MDFEHELRRVADGYREQGYAVTVRPGPDQLPPFAKDFNVEILATRKSDCVLAAVKKNRDEVAADCDMQRYAEVTGAQPGWRFDFAILEPENPRARELRDAEEFSVAEIGQSLQEAEQLSSLGYNGVAVIAAWAALEAAMRMRLRVSGQKAGWGTVPREMVNELYSAGVLSPDEFREINTASQLRNRIVHGFLPRVNGQTTPQPAEVRLLSEIARRLVQESQPQKQAA